jgi:hypothetical protein
MRKVILFGLFFLLNGTDIELELEVETIIEVTADFSLERSFFLFSDYSEKEKEASWTSIYM